MKTKPGPGGQTVKARRTLVADASTPDGVSVNSNVARDATVGTKVQPINKAALNANKRRVLQAHPATQARQGAEKQRVVNVGGDQHAVKNASNRNVTRTIKAAESTPANLKSASEVKKARLRQAAEAAQKAKVAAAAAKARQLKAARQAAAARQVAQDNAKKAAAAKKANTSQRAHAVGGAAPAAKPDLTSSKPEPAPQTQQQPKNNDKPNKPAANEDAKAASSPENKKKSPVLKATALLAAKYPNIVEDTNDTRTKSETRIVLIVAAIIAAIITLGWTNWDSINFQSEGDFVYNSGLVGGIMMAVILTYALRKRVKAMRKAGNMEAWYYFHLIGGVLGPLIIVFHSSFVIKSVNSAVALFTMITVVFSGMFGRYIYTRIGYNLHRKLLATKESEKVFLEKLHSYESPLSDKIEKRLSNFALATLTGPRSLIKLPMRVLAIHTSAMSCYVKAALDLTSMVKSHARREGWAGNVTKGRLASEKDQLRKYINSIAEIANIHLLERVLVMWRILHIPLLYILVITSLAHVLAVHMY